MFKYEIEDTKYYYPSNNKPYVEYTFSFEFSIKEEYLAFRVGWKEQYKLLSKEIREAKRELSNKMREQAMANYPSPGLGVEYSVCEEQCHKLTLQGKANMMMHMIEAAKQLAGDQMRDERVKRRRSVS